MGWLRSAAFVVLLTGVAAPAWAAELSPDAHAAKGAELVKKKKLGPALVEYEQAYAGSQDVKYLPTIAKLKVDLADYAGGARAYSEFLHRGGEPSLRGEVMNELQRLLAQTGRVSVQTSVEGAEIASGRTKLGTTPLPESVFLNPGTHVISATKAGYTRASKSVKVKADETVSVSLELKRDGSPLPAEAPKAPVPPVEKAPPPAAEAAPAPPPAEPAAAEVAPSPEAAPEPSAPEGASKSTKTLRVIGWSTAGALAAGAVVTTILTMGKVSDYQDKKETLGVTRGELESAQSGARTMAFLSVGLGVAALGVAGITLFATGSKGASPAPDGQRGGVNLRVAGPGLLFEGRF